MATAPVLRVRGLARHFSVPSRPDPLRVIDDLSFDVGEGEFVTIVGPSGSGKSTLLNMIAQVDRPTAGTVMLDAETILTPATSALQPGWHCRIGYVTQDDNLLPWRRLEENVLLPLRAQNRLDAAARERVATLLDACGLHGFERFYPHELSGGMRKRASLVRTLAYDPPVILMDEPFGALDALTRVQLQRDLLQLWSLKRKTIVFVTHDIAEAIALADRVLVLSRPPARVCAEYRVALSRPRDIDRLVTDPDFVDLYGRIRNDLT